MGDEVLRRLSDEASTAAPSARVGFRHIRAGAALRTQYQRTHKNSSYTLPGVRKPSPIVKGKGAVRMVEHGRRSPPPFKRLDFYVRARRPSSYPSRRTALDINVHSNSSYTLPGVRKPSPIVTGKGAVLMVERGRRSPPPLSD